MATAGNPSIAAVAVRCTNCGRRAVVTGLCGACGAGTPALRHEVAVAESRTVVLFDPTGPVITRPGHEEIFAASPTSRLRPPVGRPENESGFIFGHEAVGGRAILVRQGSPEPMDFDPWRWIAIPIWGLVLLLSPLAIAIVIWQATGFLPALGVAACSLLVLRFIFSDRLLQSWHFTAALNGRHIVEQMPVTMVRLRLEDDREVQLRLKGQLNGGTVMEGDRIFASGRWRSGVFRVVRIDCERTGATIVPQQPNARTLAVTGLCILCAGGLWLHMAGIPWVTREVESFHASAQQRIQNLQPYQFHR